MLPPKSISVEESDGIASLIGRTVEDTRNVVSAEIELYKARLGERVSAFSNAAIYFAAAAVLALAALIALLVGLIFSLATVIGPWLATAAVAITVLIIAGVLGFIGKGKLAKPDLEKAVEKAK